MCFHFEHVGQRTQFSFNKEEEARHSHDVHTVADASKAPRLTFVLNVDVGAVVIEVSDANQAHGEPSQRYRAPKALIGHPAPGSMRLTDEWRFHLGHLIERDMMPTLAISEPSVNVNLNDGAIQ